MKFFRYLLVKFLLTNFCLKFHEIVSAFFCSSVRSCLRNGERSRGLGVYSPISEITRVYTVIPCLLLFKSSKGEVLLIQKNLL